MTDEEKQGLEDFITRCKQFGEILKHKDFSEEGRRAMARELGRMLTIIGETIAKIETSE